MKRSAFMCVAAAIGLLGGQGCGQARAGIDPHLGSQVPLNLVFHEADGTARNLRTVINDRPTLLVPGYYRCANLCDAIRAGAAHAVARSGLVLDDQVNVVLVSIDPSEKAQLARDTQREDAARFSDAHVMRWHYLTGDTAAINALMKAIGFRAWFDARNGEYAHAAVLVVLDPRGAVSQYFSGVQFDPQTLRLAIVSASAGHIGTWVDRFILLCCDYDPSTGRYSLLINKVMEFFGVATVLGLGGLIVLLRRREAAHGRPGEGA